jgi:hypothetical protein
MEIVMDDERPALAPVMARGTAWDDSIVCVFWTCN